MAWEDSEEDAVDEELEDNVAFLVLLATALPYIVSSRKAMTSVVHEVFSSPSTSAELGGPLRPLRSPSGQT